METMEHFEQRVMDRTGRAIRDIPIGESGDLLSGMIMCRRGSVYVVSHGYPCEVDDDGTEIFDDFRIVDLYAIDWRESDEWRREIGEERALLRSELVRGGMADLSARGLIHRCFRALELQHTRREGPPVTASRLRNEVRRLTSHPRPRVWGWDPPAPAEEL